MYLVTLVLCFVHVVYSADYFMSDALFSNEYSTTQLHYGADFRDKEPSGGDALTIELNANFSLLGLPFDVLTVCDYGAIFVADDLSTCEDLSNNGYDMLSDRHTVPSTPLNIIAPHFRDNNSDSFLFTINHINRNEQVAGSQGIETYVGAAVTDLKRIAGEIDDCNQNPRTTTLIVEAVIVTWNHDDGAGKNETFQTVLALTTFGETYVLMLFKDSENDFAELGLRGFISNSESEFTEICLANDGSGEDLSETSNCPCAQSAGIYIFKTTSDANGCDVTGPNSCNGTAGFVDDTANLNPNCREPVIPQDTCKASYYCQVNRTSANDFELNIVVHDISLSNYTFVLQQALPIIKDFPNPEKCSGAITNDVRDTIIFTDSFSSSSPCVELKTPNIYFALWFYNDMEKTITQDGSNIISGICDASELVNSVNDTIDFLPGFFTVVPKRTFATEIGFTDRRGGSNAKIYSTEEIFPGTIVYLYTCFERGNDFNENADAFGHYTHSCTFSGDPTFKDATKMHSESIDQYGCLSSSRSGLSGEFQRQFVYDDLFTQGQAPNFDWCQVSGAINTFKWINTKRLYVRCYIDFCKNYDDRQNSQCWDSCDPPNVPERRKRQVDDETITLTASITIGSNYTSSSSGKKCVDNTTAIATLSGLLSALVIATTVSFVLFVKVQQRKRL